MALNVKAMCHTDAYVEKWLNGLNGTKKEPESKNIHEEKKVIPTCLMGQELPEPSIFVFFYQIKKESHTDVLLWNAREIASMALPTERERHYLMVGSIPTLHFETFKQLFWRTT